MDRFTSNTQFSRFTRYPLFPEIHNPTGMHGAQLSRLPNRVPSMLEQYVLPKKKKMNEIIMENSACHANNQPAVKTFKRFKWCEQKTYKNSSHMVGVFEVLQSLRKDKVLCDIRIETNDGTIIFGHKNVLVSASTYFREIFTCCNENNIDQIKMRELDSSVLQLLINYIYTGEILVSEGNAKVLLAAANLLKLDYVKNVCAEFFQTQQDATNCLSIKSSIADLHDCMELSKSSQRYIKNCFSELIDNDEFLSLSSVEVIKLISCNDIFVPLEEKVFECVMNWVKHDLNSRKDFLPELMEHVRLPLISKHYIVKKIIDEPLIKCSPKCLSLINEALILHLRKLVEPFKVFETIQCKPRQSNGYGKVILLHTLREKVGLTYWDQNILQTAPTTTNCFITGCLTVINDRFVLAMGGVNLRSSFQCVEMLDVSSQSPCWIPMMSMLVSRQDFGVGTLDNCVYAIGGHDADNNRLKSAEVFDTNTTEWKMVRSMTTERSSHSVGVLNNLLYVVGGYDGQISLNSVECYDPSMNTWTSVAEMSECRQWCGVGVLDGVLYAIGGFDFSKTECFKSVEAYTPSAGVWTTIADMHLSRYYFGVVVLDGLLHVIGGRNNEDVCNSIEIYNPKTNTWLLKTFSIDVGFILDGFVVNRPPNLPPT